MSRGERAIEPRVFHPALEEAYLHSLPIKEHQRLVLGLTAAHLESLEEEHRELDCVDRQLDRDLNSDLDPDFDSKPEVQTRCAWSGGTLSSVSHGLDYVKTEFSLGALGVYSGGPAPLPAGRCVVARFVTCRTRRSSWLYSCWTGTSSFARWQQKGETKHQTSLLPRRPPLLPSTLTTQCFVVDYIHLEASRGVGRSSTPSLPTPASESPSTSLNGLMYIPFL